MTKKISRKNFLTSLLGTTSFLAINTKAKAQSNQNSIQTIADGMHTYFPAQNPELVAEIVGASHGQLDKVKELLANHSELAKATWDWGFGDWETAIGAASHMGNKEIADLLMAHGARPDIFTFVMLGNLEAVKAMIAGNPGVQKIRGPHSITLLAHAKVRLANKNINETDKVKAQAMVDYLTSLGDADIKAVSLEIKEEEKKTFLGNYSFGEKPDDQFIIAVNTRGSLTIKKQGQKAERALLKVDQNSFSPAGAPYVKIIFEVKDNQATVLSIHEPAPMIKAVRV